MSITGNMHWTKTIKAIMVAAALAVGALSQASAQAPTGSLHGHVQNAAGITIATGDVKLTTDSQPNETTHFKYDLPVDENGNYKSSGIAPGEYTAVFMQANKPVDLLNVKINANQDTALDFDMTRAAFLDKMTPDEKKDLADYKAKIAAASAANSQIANVNANLKQARDAMASTHDKCTTPKSDADICPPSSSDYDNAATLLQQALTAKPDEAILWFTLGDAQTGQKKYDDAAISYNKSIALNDALKKPNPDLDAAADNNLGQAMANAGKTPEAVAAYEAAAKSQPKNAGMYYNNEAAIFFNHGDTTSSLAAANKAIAADPTRPDPYFILGQSLIVNATVDKSGKIIAPPGCADAYQKYLELAPNGPHAQDATDILTSLGETIHSSYKAKKN
jgi:tetratricopeptide (TPR) repeat protein